MKNNTSNFWIKQIIITFIYLILLVLSYLFISPKISSILVGLLTTIFVWIMNIIFAKDYQTKNDIKLEAYKSKLSNYTLVTKLQFELEFKIYKEVYSQIYKLYIETQKLLDYGNDSEKEDLIKQLTSIKILYNKVSFKILENQPFYHKDIYNLLIEIRNLCKREQIKINNSLNNKDAINYSKIDFFLKNKEILEINIDNLSSLIKKRIKNMKIIED